ncbi:TPA: lasso peptide biosynthesis B2 protein, partial [Streptococcus suis]
MDMQLNQESYSYVQLKYRLLAQIALLISYPLTKLSPTRIEFLINKLSDSKLSATVNEVVLARDAICTVSRKCRNQDGCVKRSLGVIMFLLLLKKRASWCTGFAMNPFRSHAWVEVNGNPIKELEEVSSYERVVKTLDDKNEERKHMITIEKVNDTMTNVKFRDLLALIENKGKYFLIVLCLGILTSILTLLQPELLSKVISQKGVNLFNNSTMYTLIAITVGTTIISSLQYYFLQLMGESAVFQSRKNLIIQFLKLPIYKYNDLSAGDLISRFSSDTSKLRAGIIQSTVALTSGLFLSLGAIFTLFLKDTYLAIITIISISLSFLFILLMSSLIQTASYKAHQGLGKMTAYLNRLIVGIRTIRSTNETNSELSKMLSEAQEVKNLGIGVARVQSIMTPISNFSLQLCGIIILGVGGYRVSTGQMSIVSLTSFMLLMYIAISPVGQIFSSVTTISEALGALGRITEIIDLPKEEDNDIILNLETKSDRSKA